MMFGATGQAFSMAVLAGTTSRVSTSMGIAAVSDLSETSSRSTSDIVRLYFCLYLILSLPSDGWV